MFDTLPIAFAVFLSILYHIQPVPAGYDLSGQVPLPSLIVPSAGVNLEGQ